MESNELDDLFRESVLDHCRNPRHADPLEAADISADGVNPFCGDEIHLQILLDGHGRVARIGLQGVGCTINQASGSMLTDVVEGRTLQEIDAVSESFGKMMQGDAASEDEIRELGDLRSLSGVREFPVRIKCALLAWSTLEDAIRAHRGAHDEA